MKVALLMGGASGEHDVSLDSGRAVAAALERLGHTRFELVLGRTGGARWPGGEGGLGAALAALEAWRPDVAFNAMHGEFGEDGRVQGAFDLLGIPYQGSGVAASALCLDKARTKAVYRAAGLPVAADRVIAHGETPDWDALAAALGLPLVLKTAQSGSSVGVEIVDDPGTLRERGQALLAGTTTLLVETYLPGIELTCAVLDTLAGEARALPLIEIRPRTARFFDYGAKYTPGASDEICPAPIEPALAEQVAWLGVEAHRQLGCRGVSRSDFMLDAAGRPRLLETNTLPGLTQTSLLPQAAAAAGMSFDALVEHLLRLALGAPE